MQTKHFLVHIGVGLDLLEYKLRGTQFCVNLSTYPFEISVKLMVPNIFFHFSSFIVGKFKHFSASKWIWVQILMLRGTQFWVNFWVPIWKFRQIDGTIFFFPFLKHHSVEIEEIFLRTLISYVKSKVISLQWQNMSFWHFCGSEFWIW